MSECKRLVKESLPESLKKLYAEEQEILDRASQEINEKLVDEMGDELQALLEKVNDPEVFRTKALEILNNHRRESWKKKLEKVQVQQYATRFEGHIHQEGFKDSLEGLESILVGTKKSVENATHSVGHIRDVNSDRYQSYVDQLFTKAEENYLTKGGVDAQIKIAEIIEMGTENARNKYDLEMIEIAKKVKKFNDFMYMEKRKAGFDLGYQDNYVMRSYDAEKMATNPTRAKELLKESIDLDETFPGLSAKEIDKILDKTVKNIIEGDLTKGLMDIGMLDLSSRSSLEARATRSRKFVFKKGATGKWNSEFGRHNILEQLAVTAKTSAKQNALREVLGPNPKGTFDSLVKRAIKKADADGNTTLANKIRDAHAKGSHSFMNIVWKNLDGTASKPHNQSAAKFMSMWRSLEYMRLLGGSTITASTDLASMAAMLSAKTNKNFFASWTNIVTDFIAESPKALKQAITGKSPELVTKAARFNVYLETGMGAMFRHVGVEGTANKTINKMMDFYTRINPIGVQAAFHKTIMLQAFSDHISRAILDNKVDDVIALTLKRSGFTEDFYPILKAAITDVKDGVKTLDVDSFKTVDVKIINELRQKLGKNDPQFLGKSEGEMRDFLGRKLDTMFNDIANDGVPTPGLKQQALLNQGLPPGSASGELLRTLAMLKSFAFKMQDTIQSLYHANPNKNQGMMNVMGWMVSLTGMGYVALSLNDIKNNRTPRDPTLPDTWKEAFIKGGAGGLYGDLLSQAVDNKYGTFVSSVAGPALGTVDDMAKLMTKLKATAFGDKQGRLKWKDAKTLVNHVPFQNHFIMRPVLDTLFLESLLDSADTKRKKRLRKMMRERGQTKIFD